MKAGKDKLKKLADSGGFSKTTAAFVAGAATGLTLGVFIGSGKGAFLIDKVKGLVKGFGKHEEEDTDHRDDEAKQES